MTCRLHGFYLYFLGDKGGVLILVLIVTLRHFLVLHAFALQTSHCSYLLECLGVLFCFRLESVQCVLRVHGWRGTLAGEAWGCDGTGRRSGAGLVQALSMVDRRRKDVSDG